MPDYCVHRKPDKERKQKNNLHFHNHHFTIPLRIFDLLQVTTNAKASQVSLLNFIKDTKTKSLNAHIQTFKSINLKNKIEFINSLGLL